MDTVQVIAALEALGIAGILLYLLHAERIRHDNWVKFFMELHKQSKENES